MVTNTLKLKDYGERTVMVVVLILTVTSHSAGVVTVLQLTLVTKPTVVNLLALNSKPKLLLSITPLKDPLLVVLTGTLTLNLFYAHTEILKMTLPMKTFISN
jgi:hypothetical protein